jgi:cytochrome c oxidase subunit 4
MSSVVATHDEEAKPHKHPNYLAVFIALAAITAVITVTELYIDSIPIPKEIIRTGFVVMSLIKATLVAMYYMHLKFDSFIYTVLFLLPVLFAIFLVSVLAIGFII